MQFILYVSLVSAVSKLHHSSQELDLNADPSLMKWPLDLYGFHLNNLEIWNKPSKDVNKSIVKGKLLMIESITAENARQLQNNNTRLLCTISSSLYVWNQNIPHAGNESQT